MNKEEDIREALNETVRMIADAQSNPRAWLTWVVYLLSRMEDQATNLGPANRESYTDMLSALQDAIRNRSGTGGWN